MLVLERSSRRVLACDAGFERLTGRIAAELRGRVADEALAELVDGGELRRALADVTTASVGVRHDGRVRELELVVHEATVGGRDVLRTEWRESETEEAAARAGGSPSTEEPGESALLRVLLEETGGVTGKPYLDELARQLALALDVEHVLITRFADSEGRRLRAVSYWADGGFVDDLVYDLEGTPCEDTLALGTHVVEAGVRERYGEDRELQRLEVTSYVGVATLGREGEAIGHLCCLGRRSLRARPREVELLRLFARRAGAELERIDRELRLHETLATSEALIELQRLPLDGSSTAERLHRAVEVLAGVPFAPGRAACALYLVADEHEPARLATRHGPDVFGDEPDRDPVLAWLRERDREATSRVEPELVRLEAPELGVDVLSVAPLRCDGELLGALVLALDVSTSGAARRCVLSAAEILTSLLVRERDRESLGRAEQRAHHSRRLEALGQLAGGIAHDFNNLLTAVRGNAELLNEAQPDQPQVRSILHAAESATRLTGQLLAFTRRQVLQTERVDVGRAILDVAEMLTRVLPESIELTVEAEPEHHFTLADAGQLEQVLVNLVVNARDAMPEGGRLGLRADAVEVVAPRDDGAGGPAERFVRVSVTDDGVGIEPDALERVFEPFFTTKERPEGTGLGLAAVVGIVEQHGGFVEVSSEPGRGSQFRVFLAESVEPLLECIDPPVAAPCPSPSEEVHGPRPRGHVLVVEDEPAVRDIAERLLEFLGFRVTTAFDGREALERLSDPDFDVDVVLLDVVMPGWSGIETHERLREVRPGQVVVFMTGHDPTAGLEHLVGREGIALLHKPFSLGELDAALGAAASRSPSARPS